MKQIISLQQRALRFKINRSVWNILPASGIAGTASVKILCQLLFADPELFSDFGRFQLTALDKFIDRRLFDLQTVCDLLSCVKFIHQYLP